MCISVKNRKNIFRFILGALVLISLAQTASSQGYQTGLGIRLGSASSGLTVKHFVDESSAIEGLLSFQHHSLLLTALYEKQQPLGNVQGLNWFYGGGLHIGFYSDGYDYYYDHYHGYYHDGEGSSMALGIDFIIGIEYKFQDAPITLGLDTKPFLDITESFNGFWDVAFTARFTIP